MPTVFRTLHHIAGELIDSPLLWPVVFFIPILLLALLLVRLGAQAQIAQWEARLWPAGALGLIAAFVASATVYLWSPGFSDHVEPLVALNASLFWRGEPVYHMLETEQRYTIPYGPYLYIVHALVQAALSPSTFSSKLMGVLAGLASLGFLFAALRATTSRSIALIFTGMAAGLALAFRYAAFWNRPDPFLFLAVAVALFAVLQKGPAAAVLLGGAVGVAVDMKTHGIFYFAPLAVLAWRNGWGPRKCAIAAVTAIVAAVLPFGLFSNLSLRECLLSIDLAAGYSGTRADYQFCLAWLGTMFMPALFAAFIARLTIGPSAQPMVARWWFFLGAILLSCLPVLVPAAQVGSGPYHLIPFIPLLVFAAGESAHNRTQAVPRASAAFLVTQSLRYSWFLSCALVALWTTYGVAEHAFRTRDRFAGYTRDIQKIVAAHPTAILLSGVGGESDYWHALVRHEPVFRGMPAGVDPVTSMDFKGSALPETKLRLLVAEFSAKRGQPLMWLVPRGAEPFTMGTWYPPHDKLFSEAFRTDFAELFERGGSSEFFDFYVTRPGKAAATN